MDDREEISVSQQTISTTTKAARRSRLDSDPPSKMLPIYLPVEIITEILLRLPMNSLARFYCVSKSWLSLISSSQFIRRHLIYARASEEDRQRLLVLRTIDKDDCYLVHCPLKSLRSLILDGKPTDPPLCPDTSTIDAAAIGTVEVDYFPVNPNFSIQIAGCFDGLFCINIKDEDDALYLWNPSTRKSRKLLGLNDFCSELKRDYPYDNKYGFGYDETGDDYKVVAFSCFCGYPNHDHLFGSDVVIYSAKTESWRNIGKFQVGLPVLGSESVFLNGKVHWESQQDGLIRVVFLDLATEIYGFLDFPLEGKDEVLGMPNFGLGNLGGMLCLECFDYHTEVEHVWVMMEYGVSDSWTKVLTISIVYMSFI